jgi:tryptophan-rich sensory protein
MTRYPGLWVVEFSAIGLVLAIVWNMTVKASTGNAIAAALIGYGLGAAFGYLFTRAPSPEPAATSPTGS